MVPENFQSLAEGVVNGWAAAGALGEGRGTLIEERQGLEFVSSQGGEGRQYSVKRMEMQITQEGKTAWK